MTYFSDDFLTPPPRNEFLKYYHLPQDGKEVIATLTGKVRPGNSKLGPEVVITIKFNSHTYDFGILKDSANYRYLYNRFGANPGSWSGDIRIKAMTNSMSGVDYVGIVG